MLMGPLNITIIHARKRAVEHKRADIHYTVILAKEHRVQKPMCSKVTRCTSYMHTHASISKMPWEFKDLALWSAILGLAGLTVLFLPCPLVEHKFKRDFIVFLFLFFFPEGAATYPISAMVFGQKVLINPQYDKQT